MPDTRIPLIVFGDGPRYTSGLARIARDLTARLYLAEEELGIRVIQVGLDGGIGWHFQAWPFFGFQQSEKEFGRYAMDEVLEELRQEGAPKPIVLMISDPARCFDLTRDAMAKEAHLLTSVSLLPRASFWGYFPIDGHNIHEAVGGPAAEAVKVCTRVLGYGRYGARVLKRTLEQSIPPERFRTEVVQDLARAVGEERAQRVSHLPHGLEPGVFIPRPLEQADFGFQRWARQARPDVNYLRLGCVATNQPRKDLGLYFATLAELTKLGIPTLAWLHTDLLTKAWDVGQLAYDFQIPKERIFVSVGQLTDPQLAARYSWCDATIAPGLGEGFGYPIVESLSCGTPCVHGAYAGGVELIPVPDWLVPAAGWRLESCYALLRPLYQPAAFARVVAALGPRDPVRVLYCQGAMRYLGWDQLWPRWQSWISKGIRAHREQLELVAAGGPAHAPQAQ